MAARRVAPRAGLGHTRGVPEPAQPPPRLGASDCERLRDGPIAQPVNTLTSAAYVVAAGAVAGRGWPSGGRSRVEALGYCSLLALVGLGSIAYHGPQPPGAKALHDLPIVALLGTAVGLPVVRRIRGRAIGQASGRRLLVLAALSGTAGLAYAGGRTGSARCDPDSLLQLHGAWHVLSAAALGLVGSMLVEPDRPHGTGRG